jgi:hypothetical protein
MGAVDSDDTPFGQGEDFAFFGFVAGLGSIWQHLSNAGLSEPRRRNTSLDSIGPIVGVFYAFLECCSSAASECLPGAR